MVKATLYLEGGGDSKELKVRCRQAFSKLIEKSGFKGKMPKIVACGGRNSAFDSFKIAHGADVQRKAYVALFVDSEDPIEDIEKPWEHLKARDNWDQPEGADDEQVLLMVTSMETWIAADREAIKAKLSYCWRENSLPSLVDLESKGRQVIFDSLVNTTRDCGKRKYAKGKISFDMLERVNSETLKQHLPSFVRVVRILKKNSADLLPQITMIRFSCSHCGKTLKYEPKYSGKKCACKRCKKTLVVPKLTKGVAEETLSKSSSSFREALNAQIKKGAESRRPRNSKHKHATLAFSSPRQQPLPNTGSLSTLGDWSERETLLSFAGGCCLVPILLWICIIGS